MMFRPFGHPLTVQGQESEKWNTYAQKGMILYNKGQFQEALDEFLKADAIDGTNALLSSYIARSYEQRGDFPMAEQYCYKTIRHDIRRSGIFSDLEEVIKKTCEKQNVPYHNIHKDFVSISKNRIVGYEYITDNVHPNLKGQYFLSQFLFEHIINNLSFFKAQNLIFPDYDSLIEKFSLQKEFHYVTNKQLGDYYLNYFDEAFFYYKKAFEAMPTQEICMRIIQLCMKYGKYEEARLYLEKLTTLEEKGFKFRIPQM
jgi:tetratricopeptide (TPR) repeat protein